MLKKNIFIVEDDRDISELIKFVLEEEGYATRIFLESDGVGAAVTKNKPDLVIMDLWVGGVDNAELVRSLKKKKATRSIPVVLVSAKNSLHKIVKQCQADGFLAKPFDINDLISIVKKFS